MINIKDKLEEILPNNNILVNEPMTKHTSFRIGGSADYFIEISSIDELEKIIKFCNEENIEYNIIGNGTNILVKDDGIKGIVIKICFENYSIKDMGDYSLVTADAGMPIARLAYIAYTNGLSGLEFATGIPGTIGGAVRMNAGAFSGEMKNIVVSTKVINRNGKIIEFSNEEQKFEYRNSIFSTNEYIIIESTLKLEKNDKEKIKEKMDNYTKRRSETQDTSYPNAGSTFKRNIDIPTAKMIDDCGLKGYRIGGAEISTKHAGFIINKDNATCQDVLDLVEVAKKEVKKKFDKDIELEVLVIGGK